MTDSDSPDLVPALLTGRGESHLCGDPDVGRVGARIHKDVVTPFLELKDAAAREGFDLEIESGYRSFERQLSIWNRKVRGDLPVLDSDANPLNIGRLSRRDLVFAILRWSALPGASRHHWGTDLDVYDARALPQGYEIRLVPEEVEPGGMFGPFHDWLDERIEASDACGFFRPYDRDRNGVAPERWHLSCAHVAAGFERGLTVELLRKTVSESELGMKDVVLENLEEIHLRFVTNVGRPPV